MKDYQTLIGAMFIAAAILVAGVLISSSIQSAGTDIRGIGSDMITSSVHLGDTLGASAE